MAESRNPPTAPSEPTGVQETQAALLRRLRRAEGQLAGIRRMVESEAHCADVLLQISACRGALGRVFQLLLAGHVENCVRRAIESGDEELRDREISNLLEVVGRYGG